MLKTNVKSCIEKILKKAKRNFTYTNDYNKIYIKENNAIIINPHYCYIMNPDKIKNIDPGFIASEKEKKLCKCIVDNGYKKLLKDKKDSVASVTINYKQMLELKKQPKINKYGLKYISLESEKYLININIDNLLNCFRILQNEKLTLYLFNNNSYYKNWYDKDTNKKIICDPFFIESENNIFVGSPLTPVNAYVKTSAA